MADILVGRGVRRRAPTIFDLIQGPATTAQSALGAMGSAAKGAAQATVGLPGDVESLVRMITGGEQTLPTTEQVGQFVNQYIRAPYPQYERLGEFTGLPTASALTRPATQLTNEATDALVRAITGNPQATAQRVIQETSMPFMQAVAPQPIGHGLLKIKQDAKNLTEKEFLDKYVTQTLPEHLGSKNLPSGVKNQKPHEFLPPEMLDPSEWKNWSDRSISGAAEKVSQFQKSLVEGAQFPPVLVHTRKGEFPIVEDGHHRMAAYLAEGYKSVPVSFDIDSLIKIWKEQNNSDKKVSEIYKTYIKSLLD